jgi:general secretion pathway protein B
MSYILDALRRAESERDRGQVPGLNAQPAPGPVTATPTRSTAWGPALAFGLGLALVAGLAWWAWPRGTAPATAPVSAHRGAAAPDAVASTVAAPVLDAPARVASAPGSALKTEPLPVVVSVPPSPPRPSPPAPSPAAATQAPAPAGDPPTVALADLTAQQHRDWPSLTLGGAVHSDNPASRFIIVNGQLVREGEEAAPGVVVERIDSRAAIVRWRQLRVALPF